MRKVQVRGDGSLGQASRGGGGGQRESKRSESSGCRINRAWGRRGWLRPGTTAPQQVLGLTFSLSVQIWMALGISLAVFSFFRHVTSFNWMEI